MGTNIRLAATFQPAPDPLDELLGPSDRPGSNLAVALAHAKAGRPVFPCRPDNKRPLTEHGFKDASRDPDQIRQWWSQYPDAMPAIPMGRASGLAVLDLDVKDGKDGIAALRDLGLDPDTLTPCNVETMSGGRHLYFRWPEGLGCSVNKIAPGVDVRSEGGYAIAPGATGEAGSYSPADPVPADLPEWPASLPTGRPAAPRRETLAALLGDDDDDLLRDYFDSKWADDLPRIRSALKAIPANLPYDDWFKIGMALYHGSAGSDDGYVPWHEWSQTAPEAAADMNKGGDRAWRQKWESFATGTYKGQTAKLGTLFHVAKAHGWSEELAIMLGEIPAKNDPAALPAESKGEKVGLIVARNGDLKATLHNAVLMLRKVNRDHDYHIRLNDMTGREEWQGGPIGDGELGAFRVAMEQAGMHNAGADLTAHAVKMVAQHHRYHPVRDWLNELAHDGKPRLDTWLTRYLGAEDSPYVRAVGRAFLIAMVARVMRPGCKHDHVLVLKGGQGARKSTACRILSGGEYFSDTMPAIRNDKIEAWRHLRGKWLVELAELAPSRKADAEDLKSFLSGQVDSYRMPYARLEETVPRQCVFVGTTNEDAFLRDATGGRRFWPVTCGETIDAEALARDREQLFAEAVAAFKAGEAWHLSPEMERLAAAEQESAREEDPWEGPIREYLDGQTEDPFEPKVRDRVMVKDVLRHLGVLNERQTSAHTRRVAGVLRMLGWEKVKGHRERVWVRP